jgi:uncharacterized protein DUF6929
LRSATHDPALSARITSCAPLHYAAGADDADDRPAHVRAASGLAVIAGRLAVIQDDSNFVALVDPAAPDRAEAIRLPPGVDGRRQFDDRRGNKHLKLDLEACVAEAGPVPRLIALGSGSSPARESVLVVEWVNGRLGATLFTTPAIYEALRREPAFAGNELNVEGAVLLGSSIRLFGRGNGARGGLVAPVNATCDLEWSAFLAHVRAPERNAAPRPGRVVRYALGVLDSIPLGFTDATLANGRVLFTAAAEDSPDVTRDGPVAGSAIGVIDDGGSVRWAPITDARGAPVADKVEGIAVIDDAVEEPLIVIDADAPDRPSQLCRVSLGGPWFL